MQGPAFYPGAKGAFYRSVRDCLTQRQDKPHRLSDSGDTPNPHLVRGSPDYCDRGCPVLAGPPLTTQFRFLSIRSLNVCRVRAPSDPSTQELQSAPKDGATSPSCTLRRMTALGH